MLNDGRGKFTKLTILSGNICIMRTLRIITVYTGTVSFADIFVYE